MKKFFSTFLLSALFISCSSDLDFEQTQDLKLSPIMTGNFASFDIKATQFVSSGVEQNSVSQELSFDIVKQESSTKYLNRADFYLEFTNTINRAYSISVNFLDESNLKLDSFELEVPAYASGDPIIVPRTEIFKTTRLDLFRKANKVKFEVLMSPTGATLTNNSLGSLKMRSSATVYFLYQ
jgi:hypothetical protein